MDREEMEGPSTSREGYAVRSVNRRQKLPVSVQEERRGAPKQTEKKMSIKHIKHSVVPIKNFFLTSF